MGEAKRRKQLLGDRYGTPETSTSQRRRYQHQIHELARALCERLGPGGFVYEAGKTPWWWPLDSLRKIEEFQGFFDDYNPATHYPFITALGDLNTSALMMKPFDEPAGHIESKLPFAETVEHIVTHNDDVLRAAVMRWRDS